MHPLEKHILEEFGKIDIVQPGDLLLVGVSGGADSVTLLHLLVAMSDKLDIRLCAVYVNHGLRPHEAEGEAEFVERLAGQLGVGFRSGKVAVRQYAEQHGESVEAAARELRYGLFEEIAAEQNAAAIVVAHTADDQAEELLLRLIRGTGRRGLAGMVSVNYRRVIRPLLKVGKAELLAYLRERGISYLEDSSNREGEFLRNRVRLDLLPFLEKNFNPAIRRNLLQTVEILAEEEELLYEMTVDLYRRAVSSREEPEAFLVDGEKLASGHPALRRRVIEKVLTGLGNQPSFQHIERLMKLAGRNGGGGELHLAEGLRVIKRDRRLEFSYPAGKCRHREALAVSKEISFAKVISGPGHWPIEELGVILLVEVLDTPPMREELIKMEADYLDMAGLDFPLLVRPPKPGDRFHPLGAPGTRKVADFLNDRKIPREERSGVPVLTDDWGIIALLGVRIDDGYRLTDSTRKVLKISILPR